MVSLAPAIFVDDIGERNTAYWPEPPLWVADRQKGIQWTPEGKRRATSASFSNCKYNVVNVAARLRARGARQHVLHRGMISYDSEIALARTVHRLNSEPAKSR